ncbi:MAG: hypothetical protein ACP5GA_06985 [Acidithiobacillus sp.]
MSRLDRWVAGVLATGVALILLGILVVALNTRIPIAHIYVDAAGARALEAAGVAVHRAADWPGAFRANPRNTAAAFLPSAELYFGGDRRVQLPRRDVLLWVYRG